MDPDHSLRIAVAYAVSASDHASAALATYAAESPGGDLAVAAAFADAAAAYGVATKAAYEADRFGRNLGAAAAAAYKAGSAAYQAAAVAYQAAAVAYQAAATYEVPVPVADPVPVAADTVDVPLLQPPLRRQPPRECRHY